MKRLLQASPLLLLALTTLIATACSSDDDNDPKPQQTQKNANRNDATSEEALARLEMPKVKGGSSVVLVHRAVLNSKTNEQGVNYCTEWDTEINAQRWSCYQLYKGLMSKNTSRYSVSGGDRSQITPQSQYPNDPNLEAAYTFTRDPYWNTGFDHGHICPSGDRLASYESNYQTFFLTNMQPQANAFNAGIWLSMENQVHSWASLHDTLYVCKGGTIDSEANIIRYLGTGDNKIPVPKYFFMAVLAKNSLGYKALGFWVEHDTSIDKEEPLQAFVVNIRDLEAKTGIDFFCNLPDDIEQEVETLSRLQIIRAWL